MARGGESVRCGESRYSGPQDGEGERLGHGGRKSPTMLYGGLPRPQDLCQIDLVEPRSYPNDRCSIARGQFSFIAVEKRPADTHAASGKAATFTTLP